MPELSTVLLILVPLVLLTYVALALLRLGVTADELTESAHQRLAGLGILLLYVVVAASLGVLWTGLYCLLHILKLL